MRVTVDALTSAIEKVSQLAASDANVPGVLLKIKDGLMEVCYSNGRQSIIQRVDIVMDEGDVVGDIVVPYKRLADIVGALQPAGRISTSDVTFKFETQELEGVVEVSATKHLVMYSGGTADQADHTDKAATAGDTANAQPAGNIENMFESLEGTEEDVEPTIDGGLTDVGGVGAEVVEDSYVVSQFSQKLSYFNPETSSIKYGLLTRMNYDEIFVGDDGETQNDFDTWNLAELKDTLTSLAIEKNKTIYASHSQGAVFVVNIAYASWIPTENVEQNGFTITTNLAKQVTGIMASMARGGAETVQVKTKDNRYVCLTDAENRVGVWFEMVAPNRTEAATIKHYRDKQYNGYRALFSREALDNVLNSALATDKVEKTTVWFTMKPEGLAMRIESTNSGASVANTFDVISYGDMVGMDMMLTEKLSLSLKVLSDMVKNCCCDFLELAVDVPDGGDDRFIRLGDVQFGENGYVPSESDDNLVTAHYSIAKAVK